MSSPPSALSPPVDLTWKTPSVEQEDGDVEGAAAQIVDGEEPVLPLLQAVGERGRGGLVEQAEHVEAGEPAGVLGGLALGVVEVRGHGDDGAADAAELVLGVALQAPSGSRRRPRPGSPRGRARGSGRSWPPPGCGARRTRRCRGASVSGSSAPRPMKRFTLTMVSLRVLGREAQRLPADHHAAAVVVVDRGGDEPLLIAVGDHVRPLVAHAGDQRVGGAQVDADGAGPGLGVEDFEEGHGRGVRAIQGAISSSRALTSSRKRLM